MNRSRAIFLAKAAISAALLALVLTRVEVAEVAGALARAQPGPVGAGLALFFAAHLLNAARLRFCLPGFSLRRIFRATLIGQLYAFLLPGQVPGDAMKAWRLTGHPAHGTAEVVAATVYDKLVGLAALFVLTSAGCLSAGSPVGASAGIACALAGGGLLVVPSVLTRLSRRVPLPERARPVAGHFATLSRDTALLARSFCVGLFFQFLCVVCVAIWGAAVGISLPVAGWVVVTGLMAVVLIAPVALGGIGLREVSLTGLLALTGTAAEAALALSALLLGAQVIAAVAGAVCEWMPTRPGRGPQGERS